MHVQLDTSESKRDKCETALLEALSNCSGLQKERETQEGNYKSQLNTMSEHLANMNEKLIFQTEEIQQLKFELANKVKEEKGREKERRENVRLFFQNVSPRIYFFFRIVNGENRSDSGQKRIEHSLTFHQ